jgi:hypothetical protein
MTAEANEVISTYYQYQRALEDRNAARTTVRLLESLRRLSEGHARLMYRREVTLHDAITAVSLIEASMHSSTIVRATNTLHTSFPANPLEEYKNQAKIILQQLDLPHLWEKEKVFLDNLGKKQQQQRRQNYPPVPKFNASQPPPPPPPAAEPAAGPSKPSAVPKLPRVTEDPVVVDVKDGHSQEDRIKLTKPDSNNISSAEGSNHPGEVENPHHSQDEPPPPKIRVVEAKVRSQRGVEIREAPAAQRSLTPSHPQVLQDEEDDFDLEFNFDPDDEEVLLSPGPPLFQSSGLPRPNDDDKERETEQKQDEEGVVNANAAAVAPDSPNSSISPTPRTKKKQRVQKLLERFKRPSSDGEQEG